jgi:hypothetical protein
MPEVILSNENLSIFGGPASIDVNVDFGPKGDRGSLIFSGPGKPTDAIVDFPTTPQPLDLYINRSPSDFEFLFLYEYGITNGVAGWSKVLRLIPSTALANIEVLFVNGKLSTLTPTAEGLAAIADAIEQNPALAALKPTDAAAIVVNSIFTDLNNITVSTSAPTPNANPLILTYWIEISSDPSIKVSSLKVFNPLISPSGGWVTLSTITEGLLFPVSSYLSSEEIELGDGQGFNFQYVIINEKPTSSGLTVGELTTPDDSTSDRFLPVEMRATEADFTASDPAVSWKKLNGVKVLSFVLVAGIGRLKLFPEELFPG